MSATVPGTNEFGERRLVQCGPGSSSVGLLRTLTMAMGIGYPQMQMSPCWLAVLDEEGGLPRTGFLVYVVLFCKGKKQSLGRL